jgi:cell division protein YceG involved in septum cleavage
MEKRKGYLRNGDRKKTYRICSRFRFTAFLLIVAASAFLAGFAFAEKSVSAGEPPVYAEVEIHAGDTLWKIASEYKDEKQDIRRLIYEICKINEIKAGNIQAGQIILVPVSADKNENSHAE